MKRYVSLALALVLAISLAADAAVGIFTRTDCTTISSPVTGQTYCFDATANVLKRWNGTAFELISVGGVQLPSSTLAGLPPAGIAGRLARVTDDLRGIATDLGDQWLLENAARGIPVEWFGAKGDGVTDDAAAIQSAINALSQGVLLFRGVSYKTTAALTMDKTKSILLVGASPEFEKSGRVTKIVHSGASNAIEILGDGLVLEPPLSPATTNYASGLRNIAIEGDDVNSAIGIFARDAHNLILDRVYVRRFNTGVKAQGVSTALFTDLKLLNNNVVGLDVQGGDTILYLSGQISDAPIGLRIDGHKHGRFWPTTIAMTSTAAVELRATTAISHNNDIRPAHMEQNTGKAIHVISAAADIVQNTIGGYAHSDLVPASGNPIVVEETGAGNILRTLFDDLTIRFPNATTAIEVKAGVSTTAINTVRAHQFAGTNLVSDASGGTIFFDTINKKVVPFGSYIIEDDHTTSVEAKQLLIRGRTNRNLQFFLGYHTSTNRATLQALESGGTVKEIAFNPGGGGITIGDGTKITKHLSATATLDFDLSAADTHDLTVTATGAALGDTVAIGVPNGSVTASTLFWGWVSAANTVTVRAMRIAGTPNPASGTFRVDVWQH